MQSRSAFKSLAPLTKSFGIKRPTNLTLGLLAVIKWPNQRVAGWVIKAEMMIKSAQSGRRISNCCVSSVLDIKNDNKNHPTHHPQALEEIH